MLQNLTVCSSSSILGSNREWHKLKDNYTINFTSYGDFVSPLLMTNDLETHESALISILFFEDLVTNIDDDLASIKARYAALFAAFTTACQKSTRPIIVCWGRSQLGPLLTEVKNDSQEQLIYTWFCEQFTQLKRAQDSFYFIYLNELFYHQGGEQMFSDRNWYFARCRLSLTGLSVLTSAITQILDRYIAPPAKVLVLDCDNTLWGGVIGEDGLSGIVLGQDGVGTAYLDFQKEILRLINQGVMVLLASKNNEADVWKVFVEHQSMQLKKEHILAYQINWMEKATNIEIMAKELNLNVNSFVFWDDNPLERDKMRHLLPQVFTVDVPNDVLKWPRLLKNLPCFLSFDTTIEDRHKLAQYRARAEFSLAKSKSTNVEQYLKSINLLPKAVPLNNANISRAEQLCKKTNQFNLRTIRHSKAKLNHFSKVNNEFTFLVHLQDDHGDHGLVAFVCLKPIDAEAIFVDTLLMSCRVFGRHLEAWILSEIVKRSSKHQIKYIITEYISTEQNAIAKDFLKTYGFLSVKPCSFLAKKMAITTLTTGSSLYYLDLNRVIIPNMYAYN